MANRRGVNWPLDNRRWTAGKASRRVLAQLRDWGYAVDESAVTEVVTLLVGQVVDDTGHRISLHMSPRDQHVLVVLLSHQSGRPPADEAALRAIGASRLVVSCGTDTSTEIADGPSVWAVIDLASPKRLTVPDGGKKLSTA